MQALLNSSEDPVDVKLVWDKNILTVLGESDEVTIDFTSANTSCFGNDVSVWNEELPEDGNCLFSGECVIILDDHETAMAIYQLFSCKLKTYYWAYQ